MADPVSIGITVALTAANMALTASRRIEGPRIDDKFNPGDPGAPLHRIWGMRRIQPPTFWAPELRIVRKERKTKGGKVSNDEAYADWAVALACHEIEAVRRIWFDGHLVLDLSGPGPVTPFNFLPEGGGSKGGGGSGGSFVLNDNLAIYLGTEDQAVDPVIMAETEAREGEGSCPAYRGTAYVRFSSIPLANFGNRRPVVSVEVVGIASALWPVESLELDFNPNRLTFSPDFSMLYAGNHSTYVLIDDAARAPMIGGAIDPPLFISLPGVALDNDGHFYGRKAAPGDVYVAEYSEDGVGTPTFDPVSDFDELWGMTGLGGNFVWCATGNQAGVYIYNGTEQTYPDTSMGVQGWMNDLDGGLWLTGHIAGATTALFYRVGAGDGVGVVEVPGFSANTNNIAGGVHYRDDTRDQFVFHWDAALYAVDRETGAILHTFSTSGLPVPSFRDIRPGVSTIWVGTREISLADLSVVRALDGSTTWGIAAGYNTPTIYDPVNHALIVESPAGTIKWLYLDRVGSDGVTLGSVVLDVCTLAGVDPATVDVSALDQLIEGYSVTTGTGKDWLEPLLDIHDVDPRPHGFVLQFVPRGAAASGTISAEDFARPDGGEGALFVGLRPGASDIPFKVTLRFADIDGDQQPNAAESPPLFTADSERELTVDLTTLAMDAETASQLVARLHRRICFDARGYSHALSARSLALEPGDVNVLDLRGNPVTVRLASVVHGADRRFAAEWKFDDPSVALLDGSVGAGLAGRPVSVVVVPLLTRGFVLDIPYLSDADARTPPVVYLAAAPYAEGTWPGATIFQQVDGEYTDDIGSAAPDAQATWGYASDMLPDANPWLWDRGSTVNVMLQVGSLTGTTEAAIDANPTLNLALLGDELIQFADAVLEGDGSYTLSTFKRGRRGTEWACAGHAVRDTFLLTDSAEPAALGLSEVGTDLSFKAITTGRSTGFAQGLEPFTGASLKPYAPCHLAGTLAGGDWALSWVRRTRVGGAWTSGTSIPLAEASEAYAVEIMNGGTVVRTVTGLSSPAFTWAAAMQTADFGGAQTSVTFRVYQISDAVGRGFVATATV